MVLAYGADTLTADDACASLPDTDLVICDKAELRRATRERFVLPPGLPGRWRRFILSLPRTPNVRVAFLVPRADQETAGNPPRRDCPPPDR